LLCFFLTFSIPFSQLATRHPLVDFPDKQAIHQGKHTMTGHETNRQARVPATLQSVILASNRGIEVNKPPPDCSASKVFYRNWIFQRSSSSGNKLKSGLSSHEKIDSPKGKTRKASRRASVSNDKLLSSLKVIPSNETPQDFYETLLQMRGYSVKKFETLKTSYYNKPTALQQSSYHLYMLNLVKDRDVVTLRKLLEAGISPNPCNLFGESLIHAVCRRGDDELLQLFLEYDCTLRISDDYGRTPLHDACWACTPNFHMIDMILKRDIRMLSLMDARGSTPLMYVREEHWPLWIDYLYSRRQEFWRQRYPDLDGVQADPVWANEEPHSLPVPSPKRALPSDVAAMVCAGKLSPEEATVLQANYSDFTESTMMDWSDSEDEDEDEEDDEDDYDYDSDMETLEEMRALIEGRMVPWSRSKVEV
jgi:hypothetical protein